MFGSGGGNPKSWKIKYYKGLGTSTAKEAKEYFSDLDSHQIFMDWEGDGAGDAIDKAFSKKRVEDRKKWLADMETGTHIDFGVEKMHYSDFIDKGLSSSRKLTTSVAP